jgi:hypothetical protein
LLLSTGCSTAERLSLEIAASGYGIETYKDQNISGRYRATCAYDSTATVNVQELRWRTLLDGVKAAKRDGYDLVTWGGPTNIKLTVSKRYGSGPPITQKEHPGFIYSVQGYKTTDTHPANAGAPDRLIDELTRQIAKPKG